MIVNTTGIPDSIWSGSLLWSGNGFGWPKEYLVTELTPHQFDQLVRWREDKDNGFVSPGTIPLKPNAVQKFSAASLVLNVAVCLAAVVVSAVVAEYWQQLLRRPRQFSLRSLVGFVLVAALTTSFMRTDYSITFYYSYGPWIQFAVVGIFIACIVTTAVFAICR